MNIFIYSLAKKKRKKTTERTVFLTVLAGAGADFLKSALTVTAIVACVFLLWMKNVCVI